MVYIHGYEGLYSVERDGRVFSHYSNAYLALRGHKKGYLQVALYKDGICKGRLVHRLVAEAYLEPVPGKRVVNHLNFNKQDNRVENLEWCTQQENILHGARAGHIGKAGGRKRMLTMEQANAIRRKHVSKKASQSQIAREMGVSVALVNQIVLNKRYC